LCRLGAPRESMNHLLRVEEVRWVGLRDKKQMGKIR